MIPRLKTLTCSVLGDRLVVSVDPGCRTELADPTGQVRTLISLLAEGRRTVPQLAYSLEIPEADVRAALDTFDELGWLEDATAPPLLDDAQRERYSSNLAFFDAFTTLSRHRESPQHRLFEAHVVVLGVGGLGSAVVQHLVGLGIGRLTLVDSDVVELRDFARQFVYTPDQIGFPKVEQVAAWVAAFDPAVEVKTVYARVNGPEDVTALLDDADLVVSAIDQPDDIDLSVNRACVAAGVPFIRGGLAYLQGLYWSVDPGRSACRQCLETYRAREVEEHEGACGGPHVATWPRILEQRPVNRAIGPVAGMLGAAVAMEALRYLTRIVPPVSAGTHQLIDFSGACEITSDPWLRDPDCAVCGGIE